jgi:hypothetical protein
MPHKLIVAAAACTLGTVASAALTARGDELPADGVCSMRMVHADYRDGVNRRPRCGDTYETGPEVEPLGIMNGLGGMLRVLCNLAPDTPGCEFFGG